MTAPRGAGLPPRTIRWAVYDAWFQSEPRTPAEIKQHEAVRAAWEQRAQGWHARQIEHARERHAAAMKVADLVRANMANGGVAKVGAAGISLERHVSALDAAEQEIARAREAAHAVVDEIERLSSGDPVALYEAFLARGGRSLASRVSVGDVQS